MRLASVFAGIFLSSAAAACAQTGAADSPIAQALLTEIRALRQDLQTTAVTIQRVQIVVYRLQRESAELDRATERRDETRNRCDQAQLQHKNLAAQIEQAEAESQDPHDPLKQKSAQDRLVSWKQQLEMWSDQEQQCQTEQVEVETRLRAEQAKMGDLQDQLDRLDKLLTAMASPASLR